MRLIYQHGMTTTSGGNISILDDDGSIWITPAGVDKGSLTDQDIVCIKENGDIEGLHRPSSEYPFHRAIYEKRKDLRAIIHAHPPALVSFSIVRKAPDTNVIPQARQFCGKVGYATYRLPGSEELGESIAAVFEEQYNSLIMENHGTVVGGSNLFKTFQRFETLEFCARSIIHAAKIGEVHRLQPEQISRFEQQENKLPEAEETHHPSDEREIRHEICRYIGRACDQGLMISSHGTASLRWNNDDFLISSTGVNRRFITPDDIVQIKDGTREPGKLPSRSVLLHQEIYRQNRDINCIITTQSPHLMAFCLAHQKFETRTIPESYVLLKDIPSVPFGDHLDGNPTLPQLLSEETPLVMIENDSVVVTGKNLLETFDRLEVAEFSAKSLIESTSLGEVVTISHQEIEDLKKKFLS